MRQVHYCIGNYKNKPGSADLGGFGHLTRQTAWIYAVAGFMGAI